MFLDVMYYSHFNHLPSITMVKLLGQVGAAGDSVKDLLSIKNLLFLLDLPLLIVYFLKAIKKEQNKEYNKYIRWGIPSSIFLILLFLLTYLSRVQLFGPVTNQELFTYHAKDIKKAIIGDEIVEGRGIFTQEDLEELIERSKLKEGKYTGIGKGKNLIVIQFEALQNFVINLNYEGQEITPNINKLIAEEGSLYFDNFIK